MELSNPPSEWPLSLYHLSTFAVAQTLIDKFVNDTTFFENYLIDHDLTFKNSKLRRPAAEIEEDVRRLTLFLFKNDNNKYKAYSWAFFVDLPKENKIFLQNICRPFNLTHEDWIEEEKNKLICAKNCVDLLDESYSPTLPLDNLPLVDSSQQLIQEVKHRATLDQWVDSNYLKKSIQDASFFNIRCREASEASNKNPCNDHLRTKAESYELMGWYRIPIEKLASVLDTTYLTNSQFLFLANSIARTHSASYFTACLKFFYETPGGSYRCLRIMTPTLSKSCLNRAPENRESVYLRCMLWPGSDDEAFKKALLHPHASPEAFSILTKSLVTTSGFLNDETLPESREQLKLLIKKAFECTPPQEYRDRVLTDICAYIISSSDITLAKKYNFFSAYSLRLALKYQFTSLKDFLEEDSTLITHITREDLDLISTRLEEAFLFIKSCDLTIRQREQIKSRLNSIKEIISKEQIRQEKN